MFVLWILNSDKMANINQIKIGDVVKFHFVDINTKEVVDGMGTVIDTEFIDGHEYCECFDDITIVDSLTKKQYCCDNNNNVEIISHE